MAAPSFFREQMMDEVSFERAAPPVAEFIVLRAAAGWGQIAEPVATRALAGTVAAVTARDADGRVIGFARAVGDELYVYIQDVIVIEGCRGHGLGRRVMLQLIEALAETSPHASIMLMCAEGREAFYERLGFEARPRRGFGPGMQLATDS